MRSNTFDPRPKKKLLNTVTSILLSWQVNTITQHDAHTRLSIDR